MIIDGNEIFKTLRALNGDKAAMCELTDFYSEQDNWTKSLRFLELLVDTAPAECEAKFKEVTGQDVPYEMMLQLIAENYYNDLQDEYTAFRWYVKYFDYLDYKHRHLEVNEREKIKLECKMYQGMKDEHILDRAEFRFLLKWERELFYEKKTEL